MIEFVSADWLADRHDEVQVVDVRDDWEYSGIGHIPGAVSIPFDRFRAEDGDEGMLPGADVFAGLLSAAGIEPGDPIVAYDDTHGVFAARFLVTALCYGHEPLYLLDGDYSAWNREHQTTTDEPSVESTEYTVTLPETTPLVEYDTVEAAIDDPDAVLVDTRDESEFDEGHIPGAVLLNWKDLVDDESRGLRPEAELRALLDEHGITPDRRIILYCNTARRISHTYAVLLYLGYEDVDFYEGSLTEWTAAGGSIEIVE
ncbi:sulfurtransferase [Natranaeroarchaeum aerophilus]|uniref:Sulfurtransferase n=1 Tax=Natranaeroarchaeum aerophilus TaxID=2917711 RepID=A0AAE3FN08_9EURY|nr:sulfurtransferase [Natranaeroarchaeum aerophilus]MCL9812184.1 sulfurtransferase [Natranaeroarchaeum aerophilus]